MTEKIVTRQCGVEGCENPYSSKGYCKVHRERMRRHGTTDSLHQNFCTVDGCGKKHRGKGYCSMHLTRFQKYGDPLTLVRDHGVGDTSEERFWSKIDKTIGLGRDGDCWEWRGKSKTAFGYGIVYRNKQFSAHRLAWFYITGKLPELSLLHSCDNPLCVNPAHLHEGTQQDNVKEMLDRDRFARGSEVNKNAISEDTVRRIRILLAQGYSRQQIMEIEQVSYRPVRDIDTGRNWKWLI